MTPPDASRVLVALRVNASPADAFRTFTEHIDQWWKPNPIFQFTNGRDGTLSFETGPRGRLIETYDDGTAFTVGEVRSWDPPRKLVLSWRHASFAEEQETELHVHFDQAGTQTRVTVEHYGWDTIDQHHASRHGFALPITQLRFAQWWRSLLQRLDVIAART